MTGEGGVMPDRVRVDIEVDLSVSPLKLDSFTDYKYEHIVVSTVIDGERHGAQYDPTANNDDEKIVLDTLGSLISAAFRTWKFKTGLLEKEIEAAKRRAGEFEAKRQSDQLLEESVA